MPGLLDAQGREIPVEPAKELTDVYVICERGIPVAACADEQAVNLELDGRDRKVTRVHHVPLVRA